MRIRTLPPPCPQLAIPRRSLALATWLSAILFVLIGLGIIIGAVASNMIWLGVFGFLFAAGGVYFATTSKKTPVDSFLGGKAEGAARVRQREQKERSSFMNRLENRWDERNNGQL